MLIEMLFICLPISLKELSMTKLIYTITKSTIDNHYNLKVSISKENALNSFDAGETIVCCVSKERCIYELKSYVELGYMPVSSVSNELKMLGWL